MLTGTAKISRGPQQQPAPCSKAPHTCWPAPTAVRSKLMLLLTPWLKHWSYARQREQVGVLPAADCCCSCSMYTHGLPALLAQITGGHPFLPPRQDMNAPDLYIPFMAFCTYCMLCSLTLARGRQWSPDTMYGLVRLQLQHGQVQLLHRELSTAVLRLFTVCGALQAYRLHDPAAQACLAGT